MGPCRTGEPTLAPRVLGPLAPGLLSLTACIYFSDHLKSTAQASGTEMLWRACNTAVLPLPSRISDGS